MAAFVISVEHVEIVLASGVTKASVSLTKGQTIADCVPMGQSQSHTVTAADVMNRICVETYFEAGPKVTCERDSGTGQVTVSVFVVEFDTTVVNVQQLTWTTSGTGINVSTTASVTDTKSLVVHNYRIDSSSDDWNGHRFYARINVGGNTVLMSRQAADGTATGRLYVVEVIGTDFSTQIVTTGLTSSAESVSKTITSVTTTETFVIGTHSSGESSDDQRDGAVVVDLEDATNVRFRRAYDSFGGSPGSASAAHTTRTYVVSSPDVSVQRFEADFGDSLTDATTITAIDQAKAVILPGGMFGVLSANETNGADNSSHTARCGFSSDSEVTLTREHNSSPDGTTFVEVVEFELVGGDPPAANRLLMLNPPGLDGGFGSGGLTL